MHASKKVSLTGELPQRTPSKVLFLFIVFMNYHLLNINNNNNNDISFVKLINIKSNNNYYYFCCFDQVVMQPQEADPFELSSQSPHLPYF